MLLLSWTRESLSGSGEPLGWTAPDGI